MQDELNRAKALIQQKQYVEARKVIKSLRHPSEAALLAKIEELERKDRESAAPPSTANPATTRVKTSKPLPLLPDEERELLPHGKPSDPHSILNERIYTQVGGVRVGNGPGMRIVVWLFGVKCTPLIINYFRMGRTVLGIVSLVLYSAWVLAWFASFLIVIPLLVQENNNSILIIILLGLIVVGLPFSPRLFAWVQQEHYDEWLRGFNEMRRDYLENTPYHR